MTAQIISGTTIATEIMQELAVEVESLKSRGVVPSLAMIRVGADPASVSYMKRKAAACEKLGIVSITRELRHDASENHVLSEIGAHNENAAIHGILVQLPLPAGIGQSAVVETIDVRKDVDCFHPLNVGSFTMGEGVFTPCTPLGVQELLVRSGNSPERKHVVVVGRSNLVGRPLATLLSQRKPGANAVVTLCHSGYPDFPRFTKDADILVVAAGSPRLIEGWMVKRGAVVIDVGTTRVETAPGSGSYMFVGDVDFGIVKDVASAITPVPGGVGPMTVAMLMRNTIAAAKLSLKR